MPRYAKLLKLARDMSPEEVNDTLKSLANDNRFAAVVALIEEQKELAADFSCDLKFANSHGALAHAGGVRYGMRELAGRIRMLTDPPRKTG